jgi:hypothetical protein
VYLVGEHAQALATARHRKHGMTALGERERELPTES